jgi:hypothetical protein
LLGLEWCIEFNSKGVRGGEIKEKEGFWGEDLDMREEKSG